MATPTNMGVRFEVEVWCDVKTGQVNVVGAEPRVRQLITGVKRDSSPDKLLCSCWRSTASRTSGRRRSVRRLLCVRDVLGDTGRLSTRVVLARRPNAGQISPAVRGTKTLEEV